MSSNQSGIAAREPALTIGAITGVATAIVGVLVAYGIGVTPQQAGAIVALVLAIGAAGPLVAAWFTRQRVYSPATVAELLKKDLP